MSDFDENLIAGSGAQGVIQGFEGIDIDEQNGITKIRIALGLRKAALQAIEK